MSTDDTNNTTRNTDQQQTAATDLIRAKLNKLYAAEPDAGEEKSEVDHMPIKRLSKHQQYMKGLSDSGKSLADIQVSWHEYYTALSDTEKHEVWQEFYNEHERARTQQTEAPVPKPVETEPKKEDAPELSALPSETAATAPVPLTIPLSNNTVNLKKRRRRSSATDTSTAKDIREHLLTQVQKRSEIKQNPHVRSLAFGLSMGILTLFIMLFGFFNERFITPFIRPNTNVSATPIIVDPDATGPVGPEAKIIIPKINVEAPVVYDVPSISEGDVQKGLERGVVHYATTPNPGEKGNAVIFGHSSSNILNKGKYKFAFLLLKSLDKEDTFIVQKDGKRYVYKVFNKFVTSPSDLSVLSATDKPAVMTLITCDPPGTSTNRLIIQAEQIFPDPSGNAESSVQQAGATQPEQLPSNSVTLWQRIKNIF